MKYEQPDLFAPRPSGAELRDEGIAQVSASNDDWMVMCLAEVERTFGLRAPYDTFTGEDIRFHCRQEIGSPKHPNAWGALTNHLIKRGVIVPTGQHRAMRDVTSHARMTPVYRAALWMKDK